MAKSKPKPPPEAPVTDAEAEDPELPENLDTSDDTIDPVQPVKALCREKCLVNGGVAYPGDRIDFPNGIPDDLKRYFFAQ